MRRGSRAQVLNPARETAQHVASEAGREPAGVGAPRASVASFAGVLETPRLRLVPATAAHLAAELAGGGVALAGLLGAAVPASWPPGEYDPEAQQLFLACLTSEGPAGVGWYAWYAIRRADHQREATVVAAGGYVGPPVDADGVELWFSVCPEWRGRGYAGELAAALAAHAARQPGAVRVVAHATPANLPALRVLAHAGFVPAGTDADTGALRLAYSPRP